MATMMVSIPEDVLMDILTRLPVKSLIRFRCVCKCWSDLVANADFIGKHHRKQIALLKVAPIVKHRDWRGVRLSILSSATRNEDNDELFAVEETISVPFLENFKPVLIDAVNGLICLCNHSDLAVIWNPATRQLKRVPLPQIRSTESTFRLWGFRVGFGFDSKTNDYKIIRFVDKHCDEKGMLYLDEIYLYSLANDSWKQLPAFEAGQVWTLGFNNHEGSIWYADGLKGEYVRLILSFNFANEAFEKWSIPYSMVSYDEDYFKIERIDGLLTVINYNCDNTEMYIDVWVMTESALEEPWVRQMHLGPFEGVERPLGFRENGGIFMEDKKGQLVLYEPSTNKLKNIKLRGDVSSLQVFNYVENLFPIKGVAEDEQTSFVRTKIENL